jgi:hypothetical protein
LTGFFCESSLKGSAESSDESDRSRVLEQFHKKMLSHISSHSHKTNKSRIASRRLYDGADTNQADIGQAKVKFAEVCGLSAGDMEKQTVCGNSPVCDE